MWDRALTHRTVELAVVGDPTAMRLCLERILPPCRERMVKFALPPIESAPTGQSPWAEGPRHGRGDEGGHLGVGQWGDHAGRGGEDRDRACRNSKTRPRRALRPALQSRGRPGSTTVRRGICC